MRSDTQVVLILGIVILVIIGVFLGTRTNANEPQIPLFVLSKGSTQQHEIEEININDLIKKSETALSKEAVSIENSTREHQVKEEFVKSTPPEKQTNETDIKQNETFVEATKDNPSLKDKWEGIPEKKLENSRIIEKSQITEELQYVEKPGKIDELQISEEIPYEEEEETLPEDEQQVASADISIKTIHKVKPYDSLFKIAKEYFGDETKWDKIFEVNKDNMSDPHSLYVGQELLIPADVTVEKSEIQAFRTPVEKKPEHDITVNAITHTVQSGDTLYRIAAKCYDDPAMWEKIYEANEGTIEGQDLLRKGQILIIPQ